MKNKTQELLIQFNQIYKEMDVVYHNYAKKMGLSDTAFWILYCVSEQNGTLTQRELCNDWSFAPQTVNSALKDLMRKDVILLESVPRNQKNKRIRLTEAGEALVERVILPLTGAERDSFLALTEEECRQMLSATQRYATILKEQVGKL